MNLECARHCIQLLRSSYSPRFEFEDRSLVESLSNQKSLIFKECFEPQDNLLSLPDLIQIFTSTLGENDRYLEINTSGEWTTFLAGILHDRPITAAIIQASADRELNFDDERVLNLPELYLEQVSFFQIDQDNSLTETLTELREAEPVIQNTIVLLPVVEDYRQHFLNLLTIAPHLGSSALLLIPGGNYPWIRQANQDFIQVFPQARLILDLSLKNSHLGDRLEGLQLIGVGNSWLDFYTNQVDFNPHFLDHFTTLREVDRSAALAIETYGLHQQEVQKMLQDAVSIHQQGDRDRAKYLYQKVLQRDLNQDLAWANLSTIAFDEGDRDQTLQFMYVAASIQPGNDLHWRNLGLFYKRSRDFQQSIYFFQKALNINDELPLNYLNLAKSLEQANQFAEADGVLRKGRNYFPLDLVLYIKHLLLKPLIYKNADHIEQLHCQMLANLSNILQYIKAENDRLSSLNVSQISEIFDALDLAYFAYQGLDLKTIAKTIADIISYVLEITQPELRSVMNARFQFSDSSPLRVNRGEIAGEITGEITDSKRIRIGYLGTCLRDHVIGYLSRGWIQYHDRSQFEVFCYSINSKYSPEDSIASTFKRYSDRFYQFTVSKLNVLQQILSDKLDILVFLDLHVGTEITYYSLLRLAPVQCRFWGIPVTSGSLKIDYFLSSHLMESWYGSSHYVEQLVYLPNLAFCCIKEQVEIPTISASELALNPDRITYLFTQTLLKHLPQYDYIFAAIAQRVPQAEFIFLAQPDEYLAQAFLDRLGLVFAAYNLDIKQYCRLFSVMPKPRFYALQSLVSVALDSLGWSGGVTTLDAITCNLPVVTYPGEFMRGRHSYGILQMIGVTETIAHSEQEYIEIAAQLGLDRDWNEKVRAKIQCNKHKLYMNQTAVKGLENFYTSVYTQSVKS